MKIYIELLIFLIPIFMFIIWYTWNAWSRRRIIKRYTPEDNISKKPGDVGWLRKKVIHNGKKNKKESGSSRDRTEDIQRGTTAFNQESFVPSRGSSLSFDNTASDNEPNIGSTSGTRQKKKRTSRRRRF